MTTPGTKPRLPLGHCARLLAFCAAWCLFLSPAPAAPKVHLKIAATGAAVDAFNNWTGTGGWEQISTYKNANAIRPVVDLVLQLQALKAGGLDFDFELVRTLTYELAKTEVIQGRADLAAETIWDSEIAEHPKALLSTDPIIRNGEFVKGVYVLPNNEKLLKLATPEELRACTGAVVSGWALDVKTLEDIKLAGLVKTPTPELVFAAIQKHQADFTLAEFSARPDLSTELAGVRLVPVPGCKVAIMGSRSWIVGRASPHAAPLHAALMAGTKKLRDNGTIERAFSECGFFQARVADWKRLF
jgi:hypothetical protein